MRNTGLIPKLASLGRLGNQVRGHEECLLLAVGDLERR